MSSRNEPVIEIRDVSKLYLQGDQTITALDRVSLKVFKGELIAIMGPSGSGKTTLAQILGGLSKLDSGMLLINNQEMRSWNDKDLSAYRNQAVGFIFQNFSLVPAYSAAENVMMPLVISKTPFMERSQIASEYLSRVGMEKRLHHRPHQLSGGERQRVAIARALVNNPKIIIADEPTGSLDSERGKEIMDILEQLSRKEELTVIMVTHDEMLAKRADRIIRIRDGRLTETHHANR